VRYTAVARRYAQTLFSIAKKAGQEEKIRNVLKFLEDALKENDFRKIIYHRLIPPEQKEQLLQALLPNLSPIMKNFLRVVLSRGWERALIPIVQEYDKILDNTAGIKRIEVSTAYELPPEQKEEVEREIAKLAGARVRLTWQVNPSLLGGLSIRLNDRVVDASVKKRLELLAKRLSTV